MALYRGDDLSALPTTPAAQRARPGPSTTDRASRLWKARQTGERPTWVAAWLATRDLWPADEPLPSAVGWIPADHLHPQFRGAGALMLGFAPLSTWAGRAPDDIECIQLVHVNQSGGKAPYRPGETDKPAFGPRSGRYGLLWRPGQERLGGVLHVVEGLADGLRVLRFMGEPGDGVAVTAGTAGVRRLATEALARWSLVQFWPDMDDKGAGLSAARQACHVLELRGLLAEVRMVRKGHDPASAPTTQP